MHGKCFIVHLAHTTLTTHWLSPLTKTPSDHVTSLLKSLMDSLEFILKVQNPKTSPAITPALFLPIPSFLCSRQITCNYLLSHQFLCTTWSHILERLTQLMNSYMSFKAILWPSSPAASLTCPSVPGPGNEPSSSLTDWSPELEWTCQVIHSHVGHHLPHTRFPESRTMVHVLFYLQLRAWCLAHSESTVGRTYMLRTATYPPTPETVFL